GSQEEDRQKTADDQNEPVRIATTALQNRMNAATEKVSRIVSMILPLTYVVKRIGFPVTMLAHTEWPNGLRLSGERSRAERVRCSRGLGSRSLSCSFDDFISGIQQAPEVTHHEQTIYDATKNAKRRLEPKDVPHGSDAIVLLKVVIVNKRFEGPTNHFISKVVRPIESRNARCETLPDAKVLRFPGNLLVKPDQA